MFTKKKGLQCLALFKTNQLAGPLSELCLPFLFIIYKGDMNLVSSDCYLTLNEIF